jgi:hypothetical protein
VAEKRERQLMKGGCGCDEGACTFNQEQSKQQQVIHLRLLKKKNLTADAPTTLRQKLVKGGVKE